MQNKGIFNKIVLTILIFVAFASAMGITYSPSGIHGFHPLYDEVRIVSPLCEENPSIIDVKSNLLKDTTIIDFEKRNVTFVRYDKHLGIPVWTFHYPELNEYLNGMFRFSVASSWQKDGTEKSEKEDKKGKDLKLEFALPVHYPAWARRILGKEPPKLSIKGFQSITIGYDLIKERVGEDEKDNEGEGGIEFDWANEFLVKGSIGRLVSVELKMAKAEDSNQGMSITNQNDFLKIQYKADPDSADQLEDEIIQEIVAGQTNFEMPGQGLAGFSGSNEGLWGIKIRSQWGPLSLTTIVSQEKSEKKDVVIRPNDVESKPYEKPESGYATYRRYFLDSTYKELYLGKITSVPAVKRIKIYKHVSRPDAFNEQGATFVWALYGFREDSLVQDSLKGGLFVELRRGDDFELDSLNGFVTFKDNLISQNDRVALFMTDVAGGVKGIEPSGSYTWKGKTGLVSQYLWMLKDDESVKKSPGDINYGLMWRNVYEIPSNVTSAGFKVHVYRKSESGGEDEKKNRDSKLYSEILGLTDNKENPLLDKSDIYDFTNNLLVLPPCSSSSTGNQEWPFTNTELGVSNSNNSNINELIYYDTATTVNPIFKIKTSGSVSEKKTTFNIAFGILQGTEELIMNGTNLVKDEDYIIDYDFGSITLISDRAILADKITVKYQQASLFTFDSRQFLGAYGRLDFPNLGTNSFLATSLMGQFTSSGSNIPKVGLENYNRFLMDYNLHLEFEPEWMTNLVNYIPLIKTTSKSSATLDLEVAYSALKSDKDNKNQAYIEDFKSVQSDASVSTSYEGWYEASPSPEWIDNYKMFPKSWYSYWISPNENEKDSEWLKKIDKTELFPRTEAEEEAGKKVYLSTLRLVSRGVPHPDSASAGLLAGITDSTAPKDNQILVNPWTGVMKPILSKDKRNDKYFEFWIRSKDNNKKGTLYVDLGQISEDIPINGQPPNQILDEEASGQSKLNKEYDLGIDNLRDSNEVFYYPDFTDADSLIELKEGNELLGIYKDDPAGDNCKKYNSENLKNRDKVNGKEGDIVELDASRYISEDLNNDGFQKGNNYFRLEIDLENIEDNPYYEREISEATNDSISKGASKKWFFIRIPVNAAQDTSILKHEGSPSWSEIQYVRFLWSGLKTDKDKKELKYIDFYDIKFTKNKWKQIVKNDVSEAVIDATVLNSEENIGVYNNPKEKDKYLIDPNDKNRKETDYALRLNYSNLAEGDEALVQKSLMDFQKVDISNYEEVRLWILEKEASISYSAGKDYLQIDSVSGELVSPMFSDSNYVNFVFRFGNSDSSYYELSRPFGEYVNGQIVYNKDNRERFWDTEEGLSFKISDFVALKEAYIKNNGFLLESIDTSVRLEDGNDIRVFSTTGALPSMSSVTWMAFGVKRFEGADGLASGEIWLNGLRIFGIRDVKGWAFRAKLDTKWADFLTASASLNYDEADFRRMSEDANDEKNSNVSSDINSQMHFDKFMPGKWGVKIPISAHVGASLTRPTSIKGSDMKLTDENGEPDHFGDMIGDFTDLIFKSDISKGRTAAEDYETNSVNRSIKASFSKNSKSKTAAGRLTLDRLSLNYGYSEDSSTTKEGLITIDEVEYISKDNLGENHVDIKSSHKHTSTLKYDLSPKKTYKWATWKPFKKYRKLPRHLKKYEFNLLPKTLSFDIMEADYSKSYSYRSISDVLSDSTVDTRDENLTMNHRLRASYAPFDPLLKTTYNLNINRNFNNSFNKWEHRGEGWKFVDHNVFGLDNYWEDYYLLQDEASRSQVFTVEIAPQFFSWLTHSIDYNANYGHNPIAGDTSETKLNTTMSRDFSVKSELRFNRIFSELNKVIDKKGKSKKKDKVKKSVKEDKEVNKEIKKERGKVLSKVEDIFNKLNLTSLRFTYDAKLQLNNNNWTSSLLKEHYIDNPEYFLYKLGLSDDKDILRHIVWGTIDNEKDFGGPRYFKELGVPYEVYQNDYRTTTRNYKFSTKLNLPKPFHMNFTNISIGKRTSHTVKPATNLIDSTIAFPDFNARMTSKVLEQIPAVKAKMKNLSLSSSYSFSKEEKIQANNDDGEGNITEYKSAINRKHAFRPLFKIDGVIKKKPVNLNYEFHFSKDSSTAPIKNSDHHVTTDEQFTSQKDIKHKWGISYATKGRKKKKSIMLFKRWNMDLTGDMKFDMGISYNKVYRNSDEIKAEKAVQDSLGTSTEEEDKGDYEFELDPRLTYNFTKNMEGTLGWTFTKSRNSQYVENTYVVHNIFALTLKIFFK